MKYSDCPLYGLQSKKLLKHMLHISNESLLKQSYITSKIKPYLDTTKKTRLIEAPHSEIKTIQRLIKTLLGKIEVPDNVFSGIKGRSYADNAFLHIGEKPKFLYKTDLTTFFPSISRDTVYQFFLTDMHCSPDVSAILTNFTTVDLDKIDTIDLKKIYDFLGKKGITCHNHLISGAPTSPILSYLVNHKMFDELQEIASKNGCIMSVYVDDVTFSSKYKISSSFRKNVLHIIKKHKYIVSKQKVKGYSRTYPKLVTGVVIDCHGNATIKNSLRKKIIDEYKNLELNPVDTVSRKRLQGLITAARQVDRTAYPNIYKYVFSDVNLTQ